jgi:hypothetical protein
MSDAPDTRKLRLDDGAPARRPRSPLRTMLARINRTKPAVTLEVAWQELPATPIPRR